MPIHILTGIRGRIDIIEGEAPYQISTNERITKTLLKRHKPIKVKPNPIQTALKYDKLYRGLSNPSLTEVGKHFGISRVRVCQMLKLLKLDKRIVDYVANITDPKQNNFWSERKLRTLINHKINEQYKEFIKLSNGRFNSID